MNLYEKICLSEYENSRIDVFINSNFNVNSRTHAEWLIKNGHVLVNKKKVLKPSYKLKSNDLVEVSIIEKEHINSLSPYDFNLEIVFEDEDLVVIHKPSNIVVHPSLGHSGDTLVNALMNRSIKLSNFHQDEFRPGVVHRLDKETSGLIVFAKNNFTHANLAEQFKNKSTHRIYEAYCHRKIIKKNGTVSSYLVRNPKDRKKFSSLKDAHGKVFTNYDLNQKKGKWSVTHYELIECKKNMSFLRLRLETGRTHQIRVHMSELGHHLLKDPIYGLKNDATDATRLALHAKELGFIHPKTNQKMKFVQDWPDDYADFIKKWKTL